MEVLIAEGFEEDMGGLELGEEAVELGAGEAMGAGDASRMVGDGDLEDGLGEVDGDGCMLHGGLLLPCGLRDRKWLWHDDAAASHEEESIPSLQPPPAPGARIGLEGLAASRGRG